MIWRTVASRTVKLLELRSRLIHDVLDLGRYLANKRVCGLLVACPQRLRQLVPRLLSLFLPPIGGDAAVHGIVHDFLERLP
jgi:hypothetical protein